jgi:tRNA A37 threonylcarbamoyladenosine synthetase subunit TsaC/SUA5/YrdC
MIFRVDTVYGLLCNAASRTEVLHFAAENWGLKDRQADELIARARDKLEQDSTLTRQAFLAEVLARLRNYEQQAAKRGQLQVATNAVRLQTELTGLTD